MSAYEQNIEKQYSNLTTEQQLSLDWSNRVFSYAKNYFKSEPLDNGYRGLSKQVTRRFVADLQHEDIVQHVFQKAEPLLGKDYSNNSWMYKRNLIFPLYGEDNTLDRVFFVPASMKISIPKKYSLFSIPPRKRGIFLWTFHGTPKMWW
ncbi:hypothetical protein MACH08_08240 [Oceanobacillus kimchii]|uniref:Uncharacterized protein n=2 Tax=Oceanobacillus kimchii TaxID=746691 RepID=A0ABQ5TGB1_9BACI|nr:hypothetical protein MACH08_08240 [Oceanobacillus kimchii]